MRRGGTTLGFPGGTVIKTLLAMQESQVQSQSGDDSLEKETAIYSSILPGESHGQRSLAGYSPWDCKESDTAEYAQKQKNRGRILKESTPVILEMGPQ